MIRRLTVLLMFVVATGCDLHDEVAFDTWDVDGDGNITESEFEQAWTETDYYSTWDTNGDGNIDSEEWTIGLQRVGYSPADEVNGYFNDWDDDANRLLDEQEFMDAWFENWDTNGDGQVTPAEYENRYS